MRGEQPEAETWGGLPDQGARWRLMQKFRVLRTPVRTKARSCGRATRLYLAVRTNNTLIPIKTIVTNARRVCARRETCT